MADQTLAEYYRTNAEQERQYATEATMANTRAMHTRAAGRWLEMAERAEKAGLR